MKRAFIVGGGADYSALFGRLGYAPATVVEAADLVVFTGGEDVTPGVYGDKAHPTTHNNPFRDAKEAVIFETAFLQSKPMVGICRGGQFLNVMSGGRMYQHVSDHCRPHLITDARTGQELLVSSTHHQEIMAAPSGLIVATAGHLHHREWFDGDKPMQDDSNECVEVVYYEEFKALCFQPHPEFTAEDYQPMVKYFEWLLAEFFN